MANKWKKVEPSETWDFEKNKEMVGTFLSMEENVGSHASRLYSFRQEDGSVIKVWGSEVLDTRLKNLEFGEEVKIVYLGTVKSKVKGRQPYKNYEVFHRKPDAEEEVKPEDIPL